MQSNITVAISKLVIYACNGHVDLPPSFIFTEKNRFFGLRGRLRTSQLDLAGHRHNVTHCVTLSVRQVHTILSIAKYAGHSQPLKV